MQRLASLKRFNSFSVESVADEFGIAVTVDDVRDCLQHAHRQGVEVTLLGGGTNVLCLARIPGRVLKISIGGIAYRRQDAEFTKVTAGAGVGWHELVCETLDRGLGGLENLALIPGVVGAAPIQNIGAYGRELADVLSSVTAYDRVANEILEIPADQCVFRYRDSRFKTDDPNRYVIVAVSMMLGQTPVVADYPDIASELSGVSRIDHRAVFDAVVRVRQRKLPDPRETPNAGSFFKNPVVDAAALAQAQSKIDIAAFPEADGRFKLSAARLIDAAGWKGHREQHVAVWPHQPLVLVNLGGATGREILDLGSKIRDDVERRYGVLLHREPTVLGQDA